MPRAPRNRIHTESVSHISSGASVIAAPSAFNLGRISLVMWPTAVKTRRRGPVIHDSPYGRQNKLTAAADAKIGDPLRSCLTTVRLRSLAHFLGATFAGRPANNANFFIWNSLRKKTKQQHHPENRDGQHHEHYFLHRGHFSFARSRLRSRTSPFGKPSDRRSPVLRQARHSATSSTGQAATKSTLWAERFGPWERTALRFRCLT